MALGVDKSLSDTSSQMENKSYGWWKTRTPEFIRSGHSKPLSQRAIERTRLANVLGTKDSDTERSGCKKTVTMAPVSRYMTDRSLYTMRKPLISTQCQIPILKNSSTHEDSEMISYKADSSKEKDQSLAKESFRRITQASPYYKSSPTLSREDLDTSMNVSDLRLGSCDGDPIFTTSAAKRSLSSPPSASLSLTEPPVPKWMSTPRSTSHLSNHTSRFTRKVKTRTGEMTDTGRDSLLNTGSSEFYSKNHQRGFKHMSPHQANYWACAIPNSMPPSPNRNSPSWDPEKEYQALLDYTYPLRPNITGTWGSADGDLLSQNDPLLQDSGIELDRFCSSSTLSCLDLSHTGTRQRCFSPGTGRKSTEFPALNKSHSKSSDGIMSSSLYSSLDQTGLSIESLDCDRKPVGHYRKFGIFSTFRSVPTFISSTHVLTRPNSQDELDEEFLRLPEHLQELQVLSQQLRDISDQISQPVITSWESLESEITSVRSPTVQVGKHEPLMEERGDEDIEARRGSVSEVPLTPEDHLEKAKETAVRIQMISRDVNRRNLREVEAIMDQLSGLSMSELQRTIQTDQDKYETQESLMQHIQVFCSNLEKLIQWLHKVVEKVDFLSPPMVELESVKASLADYKSFQEEVQAHKPLTADVLQTGEMLLHCMNSASPFLKDTLVLIERQSHTLETHSEYLFSSILSAMDCLTDPRSEEASEAIS
ncbi:centrosomal protein of 68 kDa isoform X1 [Rhinichthys klamathensis goyatoka]|uniref:centrosomal protein of 68 kDa isoform X1 n=2 Tax=Rhinichthys klamathensis goyatoka TaxID=3034132 RepID=UPI0024B5A7AD|nr:centrosomal protein of 68 kDa isoform X1 [Rhinichthys klamathensis goyatoka]XP_056113103.1 centrosomal protein of 68 kDa isoform X1 [Rhinichthys klamathensis goyatoka]